MSLIYLRGTKDVIDTTKEKAKQILDLFSNASVPSEHIITVGTESFRKSQIQRVKIEEDKKADNYGKQVFAEYTQDRNAINKLTPKEKAKRTGLYKMLHAITYDEKPTEEQLLEVEERQQKFFESNPYRIHADIYELIPRDNIVDRQGKIKLTFSIVEATINKDAEMAKEEVKYYASFVK
jgi:hypothetical protein